MVLGLFYPLPSLGRSPSSRQIFMKVESKQQVKRRVFVGMSGGVDSSVAVLLLKKQGYDVVGVFMRCYNVDGCAERDAEDARRVAGHLGIPFYVWDFEEEYKKRVVEYMIDGYRKGITPNPDVMCNREIKFGLFLERALRMGADYVATGHYVKREACNAKRETRNSKKVTCYTLHVSRDSNKDQSYFLWTLTQDQLKHCLFPIGDYIKSDVRKIAKKAELPTAEKKDSQGICFLGAVNIKDFLKQYIPEKKGDILDVQGNRIGGHQGAHFYTIGQRHIGQWQFANGQLPRQRINQKPLYVVEKNVKKNILIVAEKESEELSKKEIELIDVNFIQSGFYSKLKPITYKLPIFVRVRYRQPLAPAVLIYSQSPITYNLVFDVPQCFIASGQSAVFYDAKGQMLGGGIII